MRKIIQNIILWIYIKLHSFFINLSVALHNTEVDVLMAKSHDLGEKDKHVQRHRHQNKLLEKFYIGQRDEKYVQDYYELLRKADKFKRESNAKKYEIAAWKYTGGHYGKVDESGKKYEHFGFFDEKHKNAGKTLKEVFETEYEERRLKDDNYQLLYIFNNTPIEVGLSKVIEKGIKDVPIKTTENIHTETIEWNDNKFEMMDNLNKSKLFEFPIKIVRENDVLNKIEELSEYLHVKKIGFEYRILEFFVPLKFKTDVLKDDSSIINEIININEVYVFDEYGERKGFGLLKFEKRIKNNTHEIFKFEGIEMEELGKY